MRLKKIIISGFKSFADKTVLTIDEPIICIVGPNGCGKSNILDAIRWVMGEQKVKSLRGGKMEDVLFAGTTDRKPLGLAEVTLVLTDVQGDLPIDYDEVSVTRRLHRSGESEYLINRHQVRLRDVQHLFLDTGLGRDAFSIFEQGKIDQVIHLAPQERRRIFEEASGIARFLASKTEALRKLEKTELNIARARDIFEEVEKQLVTSERQAQEAKEYKEAQFRHHSLDQFVLKMKWEKARDKITRHNEEFEGIEQKLREEAQHLLTEERELNEAKFQREEKERIFRRQSEELYQARAAKELKSQEWKTQKEKREEASARKAVLEEELQSLKRKIDHVLTEKNEKTNILESVDEKLKHSEEILRGARARLQELETSNAELRQKQTLAQREHLTKMQEEGKLSSKLQRIEVNLQHNENRQQEVEQLFQEKEGENQSLLQALEQQKNAEQDAKSVFEEHSRKMIELEDSFSKAETLLKERSEQLRNLEKTSSEKQARQEILLRLQKEAEGFSKAAKRLLKDSQQEGNALHGKIRPLSSVFSGDEHQIQRAKAALHPYGQTLLVQTWSDFDAVNSYAAQYELTDYSLFCFEQLQSTEEMGKALVQHFLPPTCEGSASTKQDHAGVMRLGEDGSFLDRNGVFFSPVREGAGSFLREAELRTLEKELSKLSETLKEALQKKEEAEAAFDAKRSELAEFRTTLKNAESQKIQSEFEYKKASNEVETLSKTIQQLRNELGTLQSAFSALREELSTETTVYNELQDDAAKTQQSSVDLDAELEHSQEVLKNHLRDLKQQESQTQKLSDEHQKLAYSLNLLEVQEKDSREQEEKSLRELGICDEILKTTTDRGDHFEHEQEELSSKIESLERSYQSGEQALHTYLQEIRDRETKLSGQRKEHQELEKRHYQLGTEMTQWQSSLETVEKDLLERYDLSIEDGLASIQFEEEISITEGEKEVRRLRRKMDSMGDVNLHALDEWKEHKTRHDYLEKQLQDLDTAKQEFETIIHELDVTCTERFQETFLKIQENFRKNFTILFHGGEADLKFVDSEDPLTAGIEIIAKPPGKKMRSIQLLSGGEKCMTALALLFAIFEVRPAPFCVLDEIDAPLDDTNIDRFIEMLQQYIDRCQFLIITHNKKTMEIADVLFGVSMESKGVSKLMTLEFSKREKQQPNFDVRSEIPTEEVAVS